MNFGNFGTFFPWKYSSFWKYCKSWKVKKILNNICRKGNFCNMRILRFCIIFFIGHLGKFRSFENVGIPRAFGDFRNFGIFLRQCLLERIFWNFWDYGTFGHFGTFGSIWIFGWLENLGFFQEILKFWNFGIFGTLGDFRNFEIFGNYRKLEVFGNFLWQSLKERKLWNFWNFGTFGRFEGKEFYHKIMIR